MTLEEQLKDRILKRYKSVRAFTGAIGVSYSTLDSALKREHGIKNAGIVTMLKIFDALDLDIESVAEGTLREKGQAVSIEIPDDSEKTLTEEMERLLDSMTQEQAALLLSVARRMLGRVNAIAAEKKSPPP